MKGRILVVLAALVALGGTTLAQTQRLLTLPSGPKLLVTVPMGYSYEAEIAPNGNAVVKMENPVWEITVSAVVAMESDPEITTSEWQRNFLIGRLADVLPDAREADYNFKPFNPRSGTGLYCVFTDADLKEGDRPAPGTFRHLTGGIKAWPGGGVFFVIMSNSIRTPEYQEILSVFRDSFQKM